MMSCWDEKPMARPSFGDLVNSLELILNPTQVQASGSNEMEEPLYMNIHSSMEYLELVE